MGGGGVLNRRVHCISLGYIITGTVGLYWYSALFRCIFKFYSKYQRVTLCCLHAPQCLLNSSESGDSSTANTSNEDEAECQPYNLQVSDQFCHAGTNSVFPMVPFICFGCNNKVLHGDIDLVCPCVFMNLGNQVFI